MVLFMNSTTHTYTLRQLIIEAIAVHSGYCSDRYTIRKHTGADIDHELNEMVEDGTVIELWWSPKWGLHKTYYLAEDN
tara:strand:- start:208 stop:441 length:234 start_codon:yes stop_codon:yes gene_type:complete